MAPKKIQSRKIEREKYRIYFEKAKEFYQDHA